MLALQAWNFLKNKRTLMSDIVAIDNQNFSTISLKNSVFVFYQNNSLLRSDTVF